MGAGLFKVQTGSASPLPKQKSLLLFDLPKDICPQARHEKRFSFTRSGEKSFGTTVAQFVN
jgi:hypothetical protein